jgi:predicted N-acyltransferase
VRIDIIDSLEGIDPPTWDALGNHHLFVSHAFLVALERHDCLEPHGWHPRYVLASDGDRLVGALPAYLKMNSYGEFVFDWAWASAYERQGIPYYPKMVVAVPYTPATGPRILVGTHEGQAIADRLVEGAIEYCRDNAISSLHFLFTGEAGSRRLRSHGLLARTDCQYHWENSGYGEFDDFLAALSSAKRKKIRRERRRVAEAGIEIRLLNGSAMSDDEIRAAHRFYAGIYERKYGVPTLTLGFFQEVARSLGDRFLVAFGYDQGQAVAAAIFFRSKDTLYGRFWGCDEHYHSLHFELCYYAGIDHCIREGLARFEPGAQGEHKIARGFLPTMTHSAHWIAHTGFRRAIAHYLDQERPVVEEHCEELMGHSPFKASGDG